MLRHFYAQLWQTQVASLSFSLFFFVVKHYVEEYDQLQTVSVQRKDKKVNNAVVKVLKDV